MVDHKSDRNRTDHPLIGVAVDEHAMSSLWIAHAIASTVTVASPKPACLGLLNLGPEALFRGGQLRCPESLPSAVVHHAQAVPAVTGDWLVAVID
jgi:hypothetical protein